MITFRHGVSNFENMVLEYEGDSYATIMYAVSAIMFGAEKAIRATNPKRLDVTKRKIRCGYNQKTAYIAHTVICQFEWLAGMSDCVKVERISSKKVE